MMKNAFTSFRNRIETFGMPMRWLRFWTYFYLPFIVVINIASVALALYNKDYTMFFFSMAPIVVATATFFNMFFLNRAAYELSCAFFPLIFINNLFMIAMNFIVNAGSPESAQIFSALAIVATGSLLSSAAFSLLNWKYFSKRRALFGFKTQTDISVYDMVAAAADSTISTCIDEIVTEGVAEPGRELRNRLYGAVREQLDQYMDKTQSNISENDMARLRYHIPANASHKLLESGEFSGMDGVLTEDGYILYRICEKCLHCLDENGLLSHDVIAQNEAFLRSKYRRVSNAEG